MSKFENIKNLDFTAKRKIWFIIPCCVVLLALVFGIIYGFAFNAPLNLSMDFTSGYSLTVTIGQDLTDDNYAGYEEKINDSFKGLKDGNGESYGLSVSSFTRQGSYETAGFYIRYSSVGTELEMVDINKQLKTQLENDLSPNNTFGVTVILGETVSPSVGLDVVVGVTCAMLLAAVIILIYLAVRFEVLSAIAAIICIAQDLLIMLSFMFIFHIPISISFIAALVAVLVYSSYNLIAVLGHIKETKRLPSAKNMAPNAIADLAIRFAGKRSILSFCVMFAITFTVCFFSLLLGVWEIALFCLPLIIGLLASTFSSMLIAPSIWAMWKQREIKKPRKSPAVPSQIIETDMTLETTEPANNPSEITNDPSEITSSAGNASVTLD